MLDSRSVLLAAMLTLAVAGCGGQGDSTRDTSPDEQYAGSPDRATVPAGVEPVGGAQSVQECLDGASDSKEAGVEISTPKKAPDYQVLDESRTEAGKELEVATAATSRKDLKTIAEDIRSRNRDQDALSINFYSQGTKKRQDAGLALVFNTREAACRAFQYPVEQQDRLVSESNGISVVSVEEGV